MQGFANMNGEKNEAAAEHPSNIVATVNVLGHSPESSQLTSVSKLVREEVKLPVVLEEFLWPENCERLLHLLHFNHNHGGGFIWISLLPVFSRIRVQDITRLEVRVMPVGYSGGPPLWMKTCSNMQGRTIQNMQLPVLLLPI